MRRTTEEIGEYGFINGLGVSGDQQQKTKLVRRVSRAIERGDWDRVLEYAAAYGVGRWAGSSVRRAFLPPEQGSSQDQRGVQS
jgi:hypothetical protein